MQFFAQNFRNKLSPPHSLPFRSSIPKFWIRHSSVARVARSPGRHCKICPELEQEEKRFDRQFISFISF